MQKVAKKKNLPRPVSICPAQTFANFADGVAAPRLLENAAAARRPPLVHLRRERFRGLDRRNSVPPAEHEYLVICRWV